MTNSITKMKMMLLALFFTSIASQEESISPYKGMLQIMHCHVCIRSLKTFRLLSYYFTCVNGTNTFSVDYNILRAEYCDRNSSWQCLQIKYFKKWSKYKPTRSRTYCFSLSITALINVVFSNEP